MASLSGAVRNVAASHTTVVTAVVVRALLAKSTESLPVNAGCPVSESQKWTAIEVTSAATIAEISLHALIRHQYQRRMYTRPVPAPASSTNCHPDLIDASCAAMNAAAITRITVAMR